MYGHPTSGRIAFLKLLDELKRHNYTQCPCQPALFTNATKTVAFCVCVDDFHIVPKRGHQSEAENVIATLEQYYEVKVDRTGSNYLGFKVSHDKHSSTVSLTMPGAVAAKNTRFSEFIGSAATPVSSPARTPIIRYGQPGEQLIDEPPAAEPLSADKKQLIQEIIGCNLFLARALCYDTYTATCKLASEQASATQATLDKAHYLLRYSLNKEEPRITFRAHGMQSHCYVDASLGTEPGYRSRGAVVAYCGHPYPAPINSPIIIESWIEPYMCNSASHAEYSCIFDALECARELRSQLTFLDYEQHPTPTYEDNQPAVDIANQLAKQKRSRSWHMHLHSVQEAVKDGEIQVVKIPGKDQMADPFTKNLPPAEHATAAQHFVTYTDGTAM
jgi:hypothetical protein